MRSSRRPLGLPPSRSAASAVSRRTTAAGGHVVPDVLKERRGSAQKFTTLQNIAQPNHAEKARTLLEKTWTGMLSTIHHELKSPFGSIINFAIVPQSNQVIFFASKLAEHTTNLENDKRASLLVADNHGNGGDRLAVARVTMVGECTVVPKTTELMQLFRTRHPNAVYVAFDDFICFTFSTITRVRYIGGFGEMSWVEATPFMEAKADEIVLAPSTAYALKHMNDDHKDSILSIAKAFGSCPDATSSIMLSIDKYGVELLSETPNGRRRSRAAYLDGLVLKDPNQVQHAVVALSKQSKMPTMVVVGGGSASKL